MHDYTFSMQPNETLHLDRFDRIALIFESVNAASTFRIPATADFRHDCA
jgi:hypothetical protein